MASRMKLKFKKDHFHRLQNRKTPASQQKKAAVKSSYRVRVDWHQYFMNIASEVATRSTCDRKHVGAVIVRDKTILSTGYNGSVRGLPHCDDQGHMMEDGHCVATIHAEANAIIQAAKNGVRVDGADIYITASPCWNCFKIVTNAGIKNIYYGEFYRDDRIFDAAKQLKMLVTQITVPKTR
jgi:dCMP deaminase